MVRTGEIDTVARASIATVADAIVTIQTCIIPCKVVVVRSGEVDSITAIPGAAVITRSDIPGEVVQVGSSSRWNPREFFVALLFSRLFESEFEYMKPVTGIPCCIVTTEVV